ncbi:unnamed protein product [Withania somnifera]
MSSSSTTNKTNCSRGSSARSRHGARVIAQTTVDARLHVEFEESGQQLDYSSSVNLSNSTSNVPSTTISAYLQKMQRGSLIQPFGCLIAIDEHNFSVIAYSENAPEMLDLIPHAVPTIEQQEGLTFGTDVRTLFRSSGASALEKAASFGELSLLNPILVHCKSSGKPFYAILHRIDVGLVIDLEPVNPDDVPVTTAGALKSYKLAAKAIARLQSLPSGDISLLCDVLVREVNQLTGYDRVMVYKFHEDEHGEVVAEFRTPELEPYLGLHYPATDIPQASRFLFMKNKVRMICDCLAPPIRVIQDPRLGQSLSLGGSALRAPHGCHAQYMSNMGSIASMAMSVMINEEDDELDSDQQMGRKLWGLVVCHHTCPRFLPFPLRYACEFLVQVFSVQINKEVEVAAQLRENQILRTQTVLCDMLLRDAPLGIVTQSPNVMDLVRCDGAALYYRNTLWLLGVTPTESQIRDVAEWLNGFHGDSTGLNTDSLMDAGYPGASVLGDAVCGMAAVKITSKDFLFWFRSHTAKEIKWGGAKHVPGDEDEGRKTHPRSSFKAFLEVVKRRSLPWEDVEMDAIHSLQLILRGSLQDEVADPSKMIVNVPAVDTSIDRVDELRIVTNEMVRLIETALIPILAVDASGHINGWNSKVSELTGLPLEKAIGLPLVDLVIDGTTNAIKGVLSLALQEIVFGLFNKKGKYIEALISANKRVDADGRVTGVLCFLHVPSTELQYAMNVQKMSEEAAENSLKKLAYVRLELKNPLNGINCIQNLLKSSDLSKDQRYLLKTSTMCQEQIAKIIDDTDMESIEECCMEMNSCEFNLGEVVTVVINQVMILSQERKVKVTWDSPVEVSQLYLIGDSLRLQQVLSDFLTTAILFTPFEDSSVHFRIIPRKERIGTRMHIMHLEFRITHPAPGIPEELIQHMFHYSQNISREGLGLYISQKLVKIMDGTVQYLREAERSSFIIFVEFPLMEKSND